MSEDVARTYEKAKKVAIDMQQNDSPPAPIYDKTKRSSDRDSPQAEDLNKKALTLTEGQSSEPLLGRVQNEKMVYINDRGIPIVEDSLTTREIMERAGFLPGEYLLYLSSDQKEPQGKPLKEDQKVQIKNNMHLLVAFKPR